MSLILKRRRLALSALVLSDKLICFHASVCRHNATIKSKETAKVKGGGFEHKLTPLEASYVMRQPNREEHRFKRLSSHMYNIIKFFTLTNAVVVSFREN